MATVVQDSTREKIAKAREWFALHGTELQNDTKIKVLLGTYRSQIAHTAEVMQEIGVAAGCGVCAGEAPGSCCSDSVEDWYDPMLFFINMLLGCDLKEQRSLPTDCHFVGPDGCTLIARNYFCVHFLCPKLKKELGRGGIERLLAVVGHELYAGWQLEQMLYRWLQS